MIAADRPIAPGSALRTLVYLDAHILLNRIRTAARNPLRLIVWLAFLALMLSAIQARVAMNEALRSRPAPGQGPGPFPTFFDLSPVLHAGAMLLPGLILVSYGLFTLSSCRQLLGTFRSAADGRFLCGSALPPRLVVLWLSVRMLLAMSWRIPLTLFFFVFVLPNSLGASVTIGLFVLAALLLLTTTMTLNLPIFISRQRHFGPSPAIAGWLLVLFGLGSMVVGLTALSPGPPILPASLQSIAVSLPPGSWLVGAFGGNGMALLPLGALAAGSLLMMWLVAGDVYPELWQASARVIVLRRAMRRRGPFITRSDRRRLLSEAGIAEQQRDRLQPAGSSRGRWVLPGAWTILWKEWLATRRVAGGLRLPAIILLVSVVAGAVIGTLTRIGFDGAVFLIGPLGYAVVFLSLFTAFRMGTDLRKPIWWLSTSTLQARLSVLLIARSLRMAIPIAAGLLTASVVTGSVAFVLIGVPMGLAAVWAINALGLATYALLPASSDMRGPGGCLRMIALFMMMIPIGIAAIIGGVATGSGAGSAGAAVLAALIEGWLLVVFAASQLDGNGFAHAQAEGR